MFVELHPTSHHFFEQLRPLPNVAFVFPCWFHFLGAWEIESIFLHSLRFNLIIVVEYFNAHHTLVAILCVSSLVRDWRNILPRWLANVFFFSKL